MDLSIKSFLLAFNENFTFFCVFPGILFLGLYLTLRLRFVQVTKLKQSYQHLLNKEQNSQGNISHFEAVSAVLAGNFGTGNISGMAVAVSTGGPGALVWMWMMAFLGAAIQYASCVLGVKYRTKNAEGEYVGGPMYYLSEGLGFKKLGVFFALLTILAAITMGNFAQVNSIALPLQKMGMDPLTSGVLIAISVAAVVVGGIGRMAKFSALIVPLKAFMYMAFAVVILGMHYDKILPAFNLMLKSAINPQAATGGIIGIGVMKALTTGFDRGVFATDAGTGIVPILQASARTTNPIVDGLVTLVAPFLVMIVCTTTGLILLVTGAWEHLDLKSTNMVTYAFEEGLGHELGAYVVVAALVLFGYTTILAWACCAEKAGGYLWGVRSSHWIKYAYIALIPVGAFVHVDLVWVLADICVTMMLMTNLIGVAGLSSEVIKESKAYFQEEEEPIPELTNT